MNQLIQKLLSKLLKETSEKINSGTCEITEEEAQKAIELFSNVPMSKEQAHEYLRISRATFDNLVKSGKIPKGKKTKGLKELIWYKYDLDKYVLGESSN